MQILEHGAGEGLTGTCWMNVQLVSGSNLRKHWRATHILDECSPILVSGSDLLKHWRATHILDGCSPFLVSGSDLLKH